MNATLYGERPGQHSSKKIMGNGAAIHPPIAVTHSPRATPGRKGMTLRLTSLVRLLAHPRNGKQGVTNDSEKRSDAPYGVHILPIACRKPGTFSDHIADILPPVGQSARQPAGRIN